MTRSRSSTLLLEQLSLDLSVIPGPGIVVGLQSSCLPSSQRVTLSELTGLRSEIPRRVVSGSSILSH